MNRFFYFSFVFSLTTLTACLKKTPTPQVGDVVSYDFTIKKDNNIVYSSYDINGDTAHIIIESPKSISNEQNKLLMQHLLNLSERESTEFRLSEGQNGYVKLLRIYTKQDFEKKIALSEQEDKAFETRWRDINTYLKDNMSFYTKRANNVKDSIVLLAKQYKNGELSAALKTHTSGLKYILLKEGNGELPRIKKSVIWMHFAGALPDGTFLANTFPKGIPELVNQDEHVLMKGLETAATQFKEGSKVLIIIPPSLAYGEKGIEGVPPNSELVFMVEIVKVNNRKD